MVFIGLDPEVSEFAHRYNMIYLPALYIAGLTDAQRRFLNSIKRPMITMVAQFIGTLLHIVWGIVLVDYLKYDIEGIGIACIITNVIIFAITYLYTISLPEI